MRQKSKSAEQILMLALNTHPIQNKEYIGQNVLKAIVYRNSSV